MLQLVKLSTNVMRTKKINYWQQCYTEYLRSPEWAIVRNRAAKLNNNYCVVFPWRPAQNIHHMHYGNVTGHYAGNKYIFQAGNDIPIRDLVPLCKDAHTLVHLDFFWKSHRKTTNFILRLLLILSIFFRTLAFVLGFIGHVITLGILRKKPKRKKKITIESDKPVVTTTAYKVIIDLK